MQPMQSLPRDAAAQETPRAIPAVRVFAAVASALLGAVIVFGVGFAAPQYLHNAAHDARHSINTPCH